MQCLDEMMKLKINKTFIKESRKQFEFKKIRIKLENIIYDKLRLKNEIKKKYL
jgi:hypothetical protein